MAGVRAVRTVQGEAISGSGDGGGEEGGAGGRTPEDGGAAARPRNCGEAPVKSVYVWVWVLSAGSLCPVPRV